MTVPSQREVWVAQLDPIAGHEQAGTRPVVVVSRDSFNASGWKLCVCVPLSTRDRGSPLHVQIAAPEGGVRLISYALVDQVRSLDGSRLLERWGAIDHDTHRKIASLLRRIIAPR